MSVRGYEPIWSRFTPSYELSEVYFKAGKADAESRESKLFEKDKFVFDIGGGKVQTEREKMLEEVEKYEDAAALAEQENKKYLAGLDAQWE